MAPKTCPGVTGSFGITSRSARVPLAGADTSNVAPGISTSATRSPSYRRSPGRTYHRLSTARGSPRSGRVIGTRGWVMRRHHLVGVVAGPHERPRRHLFESEQPGLFGRPVELRRRDVPGHRDAVLP